MICANRVGVAGSGFEADDNTLHVFDAGGGRVLGPAAKTTLADALGAEMTVVTVGDALVDPAKPHNIAEAIATGNLAARAI